MSFIIYQIIQNQSIREKLSPYITLNSVNKI